jgi:hypothetical protein
MMVKSNGKWWPCFWLLYGLVGGPSDNVYGYADDVGLLSNGIVAAVCGCVAQWIMKSVVGIYPNLQNNAPCNMNDLLRRLILFLHHPITPIMKQELRNIICAHTRLGKLYLEIFIYCKSENDGDILSWRF